MTTRLECDGCQTQIPFVDAHAWTLLTLKHRAADAVDRSVDLCPSCTARVTGMLDRKTPEAYVYREGTPGTVTKTPKPPSQIGRAVTNPPMMHAEESAGCVTGTLDAEGLRRLEAIHRNARDVDQDQDFPGDAL